MKYPSVRGVCWIFSLIIYLFNFYFFFADEWRTVREGDGDGGQKKTVRERTERFKENVNELLLFGTTNHVIFV